MTSHLQVFCQTSTCSCVVLFNRPGGLDLHAVLLLHGRWGWKQRVHFNVGGESVRADVLLQVPVHKRDSRGLGCCGRSPVRLWSSVSLRKKVKHQLFMSHSGSRAHQEQL